MIIGQKLDFNWKLQPHTWNWRQLLFLLYLIVFYQKCIFLSFNSLENRITHEYNNFDSSLLKLSIKLIMVPF